MTDWADPLIKAERQLKEMLVLLNSKDYESAMELTFALTSEVDKLRNCCWKEMK